MKFSNTVKSFSVAATAVAVSGVTLLASSSASAATCRSYTWQQGQSGSCVKAVQYWADRGTGGNIALDGQFGPATKSQVMKYQQMYHLGVDGIVGAQTWNSFCSLAHSLTSNTGNNNYSTDVYYSQQAGC